MTDQKRFMPDVNENMWIRFWSQGCCPSGLNPEDSKYWWYDKVPSDEELKEQAEELVPVWRRDSERGYKYGFEPVQKLPDNVRTRMLQEYRRKKKYAENMIELIEITEVMEARRKKEYAENMIELLEITEVMEA